MTTAKNTALYVDENCHFSVHRNASIPEPGDGEIQVETLFSGVNPADIKHATQLGIRSTVIGYDFCGRVVQTPSTSKFSPGDIIAGYTPTGIGRPSKYGTHQSYLVCPEDMAFHVPKHVPQSHAACLTVVAMTAADALYNLFHFPLPSQQKGKDRSFGPLLIWGASTGVGNCALQFARASGAYPIFVTASPGRHTALTELGATRCFDYSSPNVITEIDDAVQAAPCGSIWYALDAVGSQHAPSSAELMAKCVRDDSNLVSVVVQRDSIFQMPLATTNREVKIQITGKSDVITIPARLEDSKRAWRALEWAIEGYGTHFSLPSVEVINGTAEQALSEIKSIADSRRGFGKLAIQHPLQ